MLTSDCVAQCSSLSEWLYQDFRMEEIIARMGVGGRRFPSSFSFPENSSFKSWEQESIRRRRCLKINHLKLSPLHCVD